MSTSVSCVANDVLVKMSPAHVARSRLLSDLADLPNSEHFVKLPLRADAVDLWMNLKHSNVKHMKVSLILDLLNVCDFLRDTSAFSAASIHLAHKLIPSPSTAISELPCREESDEHDSDRREATAALLQMPDHIAIAVLRARKAAVQDLLEALDPEAHRLALLASILDAGGKSSSSSGSPQPQPSALPSLCVDFDRPATMPAFAQAFTTLLPTLPVPPALKIRCTWPEAISHLPAPLSPNVSYLSLSASDVSNDLSAAAPGLSLLTALTHLHFYGTKIHPAVAQTLLPALFPLRHLQTLNISSCAIDHRAATALAGPLAALTALTRLDASNNPLTPSGAAALASAIPHLPALADLSLHTCSMELRGCDLLVDALPLLPALQALDLHRNICRAGDHSGMLSTVFLLSHLTRLHLRDNNFQDFQSGSVPVVPLASFEHLQVFDCEFLSYEGALNVAVVLHSLTALRSLSLGFCLFDGVAAEKLAAAFCHLLGLRALSLYADALNPAATRALAATLPSLSALTLLNLSHNRLGDEGAAALAPALAALPSLLHLLLCGNALSSLTALVPALTALSSLTTLAVSHNCLTPSALAQALHALPRLASLDASDNAPSPHGSSATGGLAAAFSARCGLKSLLLEGCALGDAGLAALLATEPRTGKAGAPGWGLGSLTSLSVLSLGNNGLTDASVEFATPVLVHLQQLVSLRLAGNAFTAAGMASLETSLRKHLTALTDVRFSESGAEVEAMLLDMLVV